MLIPHHNRQLCLWADWDAVSKLAGCLSMPRSQVREICESNCEAHARVLPSEWRIVSTLQEFQEARISGASRFVLDPIFVEKCRERSIGQDLQLQRVLSGWDRLRVLLVCAPSVGAIRAIHTLSRVMDSSLMLLGVDPQSTFRDWLSLTVSHGTIKGSLDSAFANWPKLLQVTLQEVMEAPDQWTVKQLASSAGVTRRTLERYFHRAGLPAPAAVIREMCDWQSKFEVSTALSRFTEFSSLRACVTSSAQESNSFSNEEGQ